LINRQYFLLKTHGTPLAIKEKENCQGMRSEIVQGAGAAGQANCSGNAGR
jgi:hypothetical protein